MISILLLSIIWSIIFQLTKSFRFLKFRETAIVVGSKLQLVKVQDDEIPIEHIHINDLLERFLSKGFTKEQFTVQKALLILDDDEDEDTIDITNIDVNPAELKSPKKSKLLGRKRKNKIISTFQKSNESHVMDVTVSVGIDLGTTNSAISIIEDGMPKIIPVDGNRIVPSIVSYCEDGQIIVGTNAKVLLTQDPHNTFASVKRIIGSDNSSIKSRKTGNEGRKSISDLKMVDRKANDNNFMIKCPNIKKTLSPEDVSSHVIRKLINAAQTYLLSHKDEKKRYHIIRRAVVTVPAYFTPMQCHATEKAALLAGLDKVKLLREPEAAALAYGLTRKDPQLVLVFDLGGGTFDVSVLEVGNGFAEVIATSGDALLGGDDFDNLLVQWMLDQFACNIDNIRGVDDISGQSIANKIRKDPFSLSRLTSAAEAAKIQLSAQNEVEIYVDNLFENYELRCIISRSKFDAITKKLLERILKPLREVAVMAGINLPGESGQIGFTAEEFVDEKEYSNVGDVLDTNAVRILRQQQQDDQRIAREKKKIKGKSSIELRRLQKETRDSSLALFPTGQNIDEVILVGGATRMPSIRRLVRVVTGVDPKMTVNPDEAVSLGAAVLAGILDGEIKDMNVMSSWKATMIRTIAQIQASINSEKETGNKYTEIQLN